MVHPRVNEIFARANERRGVNEIFARANERRGVNEISVSNFLHSLVVTCIFLFFYPTHKHSLLKWPTSSVLTLRLQRSETYHFSKPCCGAINCVYDIIRINFTERCHVWLTPQAESLPCSVWGSCAPVRSTETTVLSQVLFSISSEHQTHEHWSDLPYQSKCRPQKSKYGSSLFLIFACCQFGIDWNV